MRWVRRTIWVALMGLGLIGLLGPGALAAQEDDQVLIIEVHGTIDLGLTPYLKRVLEDAHEQAARSVILEIDTPGGRLDAALEIKDTLLGSTVPVVAFVNREAFSAGALIAIAAHQIYMTPGAALGAATPVDQEGTKASEKVVSAVRTAFRSTAEARNRDPDVAEAMVDESVAVGGLVEEGKLLTLTTGDALQWGFVDGEVEDLEELLETLGLSGNTVVRTSPSWSEDLVRFITNPVLASLFISLGFVGLLFELTSPGFGVAGLAGIALLALFFWGHLLAGLAGWEGVALVGLGLALMAVEALFVPGFGLVGLAGITAFMIGLFLSLVGQGASGADFQRAALVLLGSLLLMAAGGFAVLKYVPRGRLFGALALQRSLPPGPGMEPGLPRVDMRQAEAPGTPQSAMGPMLGVRGQAITDLHPAGIVQIDNQRVDVVTEGGFVASGTAIEVIADEGYRRVVRPVEPPGATESGG